MAADKELKRAYNAYTDCWRFYKKYADIQNTSDFWQSVATESEQIAKKYGDEKFVVDLLVATCDELQRAYMTKYCK